MSSDINVIILNYLREELTQEEELKLKEWCDEKPSNKENLDLLVKVWKTQMGYQDILNIEDQKKMVWEKLEGTNGYSGHPKQISLTRIVMRYAAVIAVIFAVGLYYFSSDDKAPIVQAHQVVKENPNGVKSQIQLPDGTHVWLNAASSISYQQGFSDTARSVVLKGEAYFEVVRDETRPFRVLSEHVITTALGTSFNVNSYEKNNIHISLISGKVKVATMDKKDGIILTPGNQAISGGAGLQVSQFYQDKVLGWKNGTIYFDNTDFDEMISKLEKWYDVKFKIPDLTESQKSMKAVGQFENESLENVLKVLSHSMSFEFSIDKNIVTIKPRKKK